MTVRGRLVVLCAVAATQACASAPPGSPVPSPIEPRLNLPDVPAVDGTLRIDVVYPLPDAQIPAVDSTFVFGSVGTGRATLSINDAGIEVAPNGTFLAFVVVPADGVYHLRATLGDRSITRDHTVRVMEPPSVPATGATILAGTIEPSGALALPFGEPVEVRFLGTSGGQATLRLPSGERIPLIEQPLRGGADTDVANFSTGVRAGPAVSGVSQYAGVTGAEPWIAIDSSVPLPSIGRGQEGLGFFVSMVTTEVQADTLAERLAREAGLPVPAQAERDSIMLLVDRFAAVADSLMAFMARYPHLQIRAPIVELVVGDDTMRAPVHANVNVLGPGIPVAGTAVPPAGAAHDWTARGRPGLAGPFHWFFPPGTRLGIDGERTGSYRVRLAPDIGAWVAKSDIRLDPQGAPPPNAAVTGVRFVTDSGHIDVRVALPLMLPVRVDADASALDITVYGATSEVNFFQYGSLDPLVARAGWSQPADRVFRVHVELTQPVWGWLSFFDETGALVVRIRRPPPIDENRPLRGMRVAVDPGHPPGGGTGPSRLTEAEANLGIATKLRPLLEERGAIVLMTRDDPGPVELGARPRMATEWNAHVLVSLHNNAFPDGVNPFVNNGTSVYYYQPQSVDFARIVQRELLNELGTRDIGIGRADLALVRPTWMPSVLSETLFMMLPRQEAALRDPLVQERIARAHLQALERFLRERAAAQRSP